MTTYYEAQERAMCPGIADPWPTVISAPHSKHGRLRKMPPSWGGQVEELFKLADIARAYLDSPTTSNRQQLQSSLELIGK